MGVPSIWVYRSLKRDRKHLDKEILGIETKLLSLVRQDQQAQLTLLQSIPGIGIITAMKILTELEDIKRFKNLDQLCGYIGLVPTTKSSGEKDKVGEMTNRGNKYLKTATQTVIIFHIVKP